MFRQNLLRGAVSLAALIWVWAAFALAAPQAASETVSPKAEASFLVGETARIDLRQRLLVVKPDGVDEELEIRLDDSTRITSGGRTIRLEDLRAGDRVAVSCSDPCDGEQVARVVAARGPARRSPPPGPSPAASKP